MNIGKQIKKLRKSLDLTQQKFGARLGIKGNTIAQYELGRNEPIDAVLSLICREFGINEEWLRTGEGEMYRPAPADVLDQLAAKYKLSNSAYVMVEKFLKLRPEIQNGIYDYVQEVNAALMEDDIDPYAQYNGKDEPQPMDKLIERRQKTKLNAVSDSEPTTEELEDAYKKSYLNSARNTGFPASNTTAGNDRAGAESLTSSL